MTDPRPEPREPSFLEAAQHKRRGLVGDMVGFLRETRQWWMIPILIVLGLVGIVAIVVTFVPAAGPWLYSFF